MVGHTDKEKEEMNVSIVDPTGLIDELTAENEMLRKRLSELEKEYTDCKQRGLECYQSLQSFKQMKEELSVCFTIQQEKPLVITGIALAEGQWNGKYYDHSIVSQAVSLLPNMLVYVEHKKTEKYQDRVVGRVLEAEWNDTLKCALFKMEITDEDAKQDVLTGKFKAVSLGGYTEVDIKDNQLIVTKLMFEEISLTETPACKKCLIMHTESLAKDISRETSTDNSGVSTMSEKEETLSEETVEEETKAQVPSEETVTEEEYFELTEETVLALPEEIELEIIPIEEARRRRRVYYPLPIGRYPRKMKKIATYYYYGLPYVYPYYPYYPYLYPYVYPYRYPLPEEAIKEIREAIEKIVAKYRKKPEKQAEEEKIEEQMPLKCEYCDFVADTKEALLDHIAKQHPEEFERRYGYPPKERMKEEEKSTETVTEEMTEQKETLSPEEKKKQALEKMTAEEALILMHILSSQA